MLTETYIVFPPPTERQAVKTSLSTEISLQKVMDWFSANNFDGAFNFKISLYFGTAETNKYSNFPGGITKYKLLQKIIYWLRC